ncbi:MAG: hypothetical protein M5U34_29230 [Chloroflexi bacterium]|nr:hypothetical protein [Chloroflexota bacterium]
MFLPARGKENGRYSAKPLHAKLLHPGKPVCFSQHVGRGTAVTQPTR